VIDLTLSEQQLSLRETARQFARQEMAPLAAKYDQSMEYPWEVLQKAHATGLLNLSLPESVGGVGLPMVDQAIIAEELAWGCTGMQTAMGANDLALGPLLIAGNQEQLEMFAKPMVDGLSMAAYCVTEPGAGSDVQAIRTRVRKDGDHYVMNGSKMWITNGSKAKWYYVLASLDPAQGYKAMCAFAIPADLPGIQPGKKEVNMGQRCSDTRGITFTDVKVHKRYLLGQEGDGFKIAMKAFDLSRPGTATSAVGLAQCALDHSVRYAQERTSFGKPIAAHQAVSFMIADMAQEIEAARLLVYRAAHEHDAGRRNTKFASMAKCFAGDAAVRATASAVQIFGGYGYNAEYPVEKLYRDAKIFQIYEGTNQIQRLIISRHVLEEGAVS
jgi:acyl-CoA dehydrogenase